MDDCIEWRGYKNRHGYGTLKRGKRHLFAHRVAYCKHNGVNIDSINGLIVRHQCDNPGCVNPGHLLIGTTTDNIKDKVERGRVLRGEKNPSSKLTTAQVVEIRSTYIRGSKEFGGAVLARKFGVSEQTVSSIVRNRMWVTSGHQS
jgi:hypothetical protein